MPTIEKRVSKLEEALTTHLIESGAIRSDLRWLKKFMWFVLGSPIAVEVVKHIHLMAGK